MTTTTLKNAIDTLISINAAAEGGFDAGKRRADALISGLMCIAAGMGATLKNPIQIDSRGDISIVCETGVYGSDFANFLNKGAPRTGMYPGAVMTETSSWCHMNHFSLEKIILSLI